MLLPEVGSAFGLSLALVPRQMMPLTLSLQAPDATASSADRARTDAALGRSCYIGPTLSDSGMSPLGSFESEMLAFMSTHTALGRNRKKAARRSKGQVQLPSFRCICV